MKVYVLLYHDVWEVSHAEPEGGPKDVSIEGVYPSYEAAKAAQAKSGTLLVDDTSDIFDDEDVRTYHTIEEHDLALVEATQPA